MAKESSAAEPGLPDGITGRHLRGSGGWLRGFVPIAVLGALLLAALLGVFGGTSNPQVTVENNGVKLTVTAPRTLRKGMIFETDIAVDAARPVAKPVIAITGAYLHDLTINTTMPQAAEEGFERGEFTLTYDAMKPGDRLEVKIDGQVNPTLFGRNTGSVVIRDDKVVLVRQPLHLRVFP